MHFASLTVVGLGLKLISHVTAETRASLEGADKVFMVLADEFTAAWVEDLNPHSELLPFCDDSTGTYEEWWQQVDRWVEQILSAVAEGMKVCVVFYGHPSVGVPPAHELVRRARARGIQSRLLPAVCAEDCLFADLNIQPLVHGCQSFEATDFLIRRRDFSTHSLLILWQIGMIGELAQRRVRVNRGRLRVLTEVLEAAYSRDHEVFVYEAAQHAIADPVLQRLPLSALPDARITERSTLYVPPTSLPPVDYDMVERLRIPPHRIKRHDGTAVDHRTFGR